MNTPAAPLTTREKQILRRMALGRSDAEIAHQIGGSEAQVATQRLRLLRKLNIYLHAEIIEAAIDLGPWPYQMKRPSSPSRLS
ncbi:response regulator transcription factor [Bradyrhizobium sp. 6(2017)]|uniref:response regulator transcription factor n=1 Tax=Bradyrhizobium sp. 6(2017) TaxID=1197460 RepID=UPI0013E111CD|nr:response regulator transcription factor [Bradyrhizobium sp. 6(2017)]